jgi:hypothetical protein
MMTKFFNQNCWRIFMVFLIVSGLSDCAKDEKAAFKVAVSRAGNTTTLSATRK